MGHFILRRLLMLVPFLFLVSALAFIVIQLPPGSFIDTYRRNLEAQGGTVNEAQLKALEVRYGLDKPVIVQYAIWTGNILSRGDFGNSFRYQRPVADILWERVPRTVGISLLAIVFTWIIAIPLGIISAIKQYSIWDYVLTFLSFIGLSVPAFLLAIVLMYVVFTQTGWLVTGLYSPQFQNAPMSVAKFVDLLKNIWLPLLVLAVTGAAGTIRVLRATLLDELQKPYVTTARAKGLPEWRVILKYPVRLAINPMISTIGWLLPAVVGGELVVSKVLNLPTVGPIILEATLAQDMFLAGAFVLILSALTLIGTLISDICLAWLDPRIRY
ncbi:ABC transporter permease [Kouleothrix aurantiaca]|uniref:ABC transporter permease n=1 Tax=Kouleothrix aurantiaca TaxID=186479 RepID=A0A0P9HIY0_9CHLR|nr:ABC transporter permease [Kouleothrix aurantiaca]